MTTLYALLRNEIAEALGNRNRSDLADRLGSLDDDAIRDAATLMVDAIEEQLDRPFTVGKVESPGVIERFATESEASQYITDSFPAEEVAAGAYYIDGPPDDAEVIYTREFDTDEIRRALEGDSNDAEHDALVSVASTLGITYRDPDHEDEDYELPDGALGEAKENQS